MPLSPPSCGVWDIGSSDNENAGDVGREGPLDASQGEFGLVEDACAPENSKLNEEREERDTSACVG